MDRPLSMKEASANFTGRYRPEAARKFSQFFIVLVNLAPRGDLPWEKWSRLIGRVWLILNCNEGGRNEPEAIHAGTDYRDAAGSGGSAFAGTEDRRGVPSSGHLGAELLPLVQRLKALEKENARLRKAVSDLTLDKLILKEALEGNY